MLGKMKGIAAVSALTMCACAAVYRRTGGGLWLSLAITAGTFFYHFGMRLLVGLLYGKTMGNRADYRRRRYQVSGWERRLYDVLQVKRWKNRMPVLQPELFDPGKCSWDQIAQAMCQAELVHETNTLLSFVPLLAAGVFGAAAVFLVTSLLAACFDLMFVVMQRYNRPRVMRLLEQERTRRDRRDG